MNLTDLIKSHEGLRLKVYKDTEGIMTIGYGRNLETGIHLDEAELMFANDVKKAIDRCSLMIPLWDNYDEVRQAVFADMAFNLGISGLLQFKKFLMAMHLKQWSQAKAEMLDSKWAVQVGRRAIELAEMVETGKWPHG